MWHKQVMAKALRFLAHSHGAALVYHSQKEDTYIHLYHYLSLYLCICKYIYIYYI